jgi:DNA-binding response OmpR family regulator
MARKILLADDSVAVQKAVEATLEPRDFEVFSVSGGKAAIQEARRIHPDAILLDSDLPDTDGYELCRRLKKDPELKDIPVILMTSDGEGGEEAKALEAGADAHLPKPFLGRDLMDRVSAVVDLTEASTIRIESADMEVLDFGEELESTDESLRLDEADLGGKGGALDLTEEMGPELEEGAELELSEEFTIEDEGELDLNLPGGPSGAAKGVKTEEIEEISFEEELEELDLGGLEMEGAEEAVSLEEDLGMTLNVGPGVEAGKELLETQEEGPGIEIEEELSLAEEELTSEIELVSTGEEEEIPSEELGEILSGEGAVPPRALVDTGEEEEIALEEDTLDLGVEAEEELALEELEETVLETPEAGLSEVEGEGPTLDEEPIVLEEDTLDLAAEAKEELALEELEETVLETPEAGLGAAEVEEGPTLDEEEMILGEELTLGEEEEALAETSIDWETLGELPVEGEIQEEPVEAEEVGRLRGTELVDTGIQEAEELGAEAILETEEAVAELLVEAPEAPRMETPAVAPAPLMRATSAPETGLLEEVELEEEIASVEAEKGVPELSEEGLLLEMAIEEVPYLDKGLRVELTEEDFGLFDPFSEEGVRREISRNLHEMVEKILADMAPPIVERVARRIASEQAQRIIMEEMARRKAHPEGA